MQNAPRQNFGQFWLGGQRLFGELVIDERLTNLRVHGQDYIKMNEAADRCVVGELSDGTRVTLLDCNIPPVPGHRSSGRDVSYFADIFPHYVALGRTYLSPGEEAVAAIRWHLPDIDALFYDFDAFGFSLEPEKFIDGILAEQEKQTGRQHRRGPHPEVLYFSGESEIFTCPLGNSVFSVHHSFEQSSGGPKGIWIKNEIQISLRFSEMVSFNHAMDEAYKLSTFLSIAIGRPQSIEKISVAPDYNEQTLALQVLPSLPQRYQTETGTITPGPRDVLLDGLERPDEFASVLKHWVDTQQDMAAARGRFWDSFRKQNFFDADRIIAAANLFDIIPSNYYPQQIELPEDLHNAVEKATSLIKPLPKTQERASLLGALSRVSKPALKSKIKHWAKPVIEQHQKQYSELDFVIDRAVNCRNFFVHGGKPEFDYFDDQNAIHILGFLTRSLEFCYIMPELMKADWKWTVGGYHPFGEFTFNYLQDLERLKKAYGRGSVVGQ